MVVLMSIEKNLDKLVKSVIEDEEYSIVKRFYAYMETKYLSEDLLKFFRKNKAIVKMIKV